MKLYEVSPGYFYDDTHKRWSLFKMNDGQWRLEDLAPDSHSNHPTFAAAIAALKSHVGDVTVHRKKARMEMKQAVLKLAQENPEFRKTLIAELKTARKHEVLKAAFHKGFKEGEGTPGGEDPQRDFALAFRGASKELMRLKDIKSWFGPLGMSQGTTHRLEINLDDLAHYAGVYFGQREASEQNAYPEVWNRSADKTADRWENKPKGWTDESRKKFWNSLTSAAPKHKVTECIKRMNKHMGGNAGAFCASLADRVMPGWRQEAAKDRAKKGSSLAQPLSLRRDYGSSEDEWLDQEEVRKHCPPCADKMARNGIRKVKASALRIAMQRR